MEPATASDDRALVLSGPVTAQTVAETRQRMLEQLARGPGAPACTLDAREVTQLDAAGAQLLYAFLIQARHQGTAVRWTAASVFLVEAARVLGMERLLELAELPAEVVSWHP